ncbi:MAG: phosphomannomutase/phosphoglucomutase [Candidatus Saccharimonadales bacterium]
MNLDKIFKAYDIRGQVPTELNADTARAIGLAFGSWLPGEGKVAVGRDMRISSQELTSAFIEGLLQAGRNVWDLGQITSDMIYFAVGKYGLSGGAMITASHNPAADNGIKLTREGVKPVGIENGLLEIKKATESILKNTEQIKVNGSVEQKDITKDWIKHVLSFIDGELKPLKVAIDAGNGMAGAIITHLQKEVPLEIVPMYFEPDDSFPNHPANPMVPENLEDLINKVKAEKCNVGVAFDADGDRAVLVDESGQLVNGSTLTAFLAQHYLKTNKGANIVHNAICSKAVPETILENRGVPIRSRVGHSFMKAKMREMDAPFGGEHSAHYYFKENYYADSGLIAAIISLSVLSGSGKKLSQLIKPYQKYASSGEVNFEVADKQGKLEELGRKFVDGEVDWLDGLTVSYKNWWFNVRPSNTENLLRLNVEADSSEILEEKVALISRVISSI